MRIGTLLTVPFLALLALLALPPVAAPAQVAISVAFGTRLGPEIGVSGYSVERQGEWRNNYRKWTPVTLYDVNGHYYHNEVAGGRAVVVYSYNNEYFLPPQDQGWNGIDKRYNYQRQPNESDYGRAVSYTPHVAVSVRFGSEVGVLAYSAERAGDWHANYRNWTPVTLYEINGRYYPKNGPGARAVSMYRFQDEYFLPPTDEKWIGADSRFDYKHRPNQQDQGRVRDRP